MIPVFLFFGLCFLGIGDCNNPLDETIHELNVLQLEIQLQQLDVTIYDYIGDGCLQTKFENPTKNDNYDDKPDNYGKVISSQGWFDGKLWRNLNGTIITETFCSVDVWDVFEKNYHYDEIDFKKGEVCYDGEWIRYISDDVKCKQSAYEKYLEQQKESNNEQ